MPIDYRKQTDYFLIECLLETELEYLKKYIEEQYASLKEHESKIRDLVNDEIWIEKTEPLPTLGIELLVHSSSYSYQIFYKSALITLYSFFENLMKEISKIARQVAKTDLAPKGIGVLADKEYLTNVIGLKFLGIDTLWEKLNEVRLVRNYFVHAYLEQADNKYSNGIKNISEKNPYLNLDKLSNELTIMDKEYIMEFYSLIKEIARGLIKNR